MTLAEFTSTPRDIWSVYVSSSGQVGDRRLKRRLAYSLLPDPYGGVHLLLDLGNCLAPPPGGDPAFIQLVNLSSRSTVSNVSSLILCIILYDEGV